MTEIRHCRKGTIVMVQASISIKRISQKVQMKCFKLKEARIIFVLFMQVSTVRSGDVDLCSLESEKR